MIRPEFESLLHTVFATVARVVRSSSSEARNNPEAMEALDREIENIRSKHALFWLETYEEDEVCKKIPDAEFDDCLMLLGEKFVELPPEQRE